MSAPTILPAPGVLPTVSGSVLPPVSRVQESRAGGVVTRPTPPAPWMHDTCPECGFDGDVAVVRDEDQGLMGWECPDCSTFVTTRDLVPDEREDMFA